MNIQEIMSAMSRRVPWPVALRLLREQGIPRSHGWQKTIDALDEPQADYSEKEGDLEKALVEHWLCGEKLVRFYKVTAQQRADLLRAVVRLKVPESALKTAYPGYLADDALQAAPIDPTLIAIGRNADGVGVAFASARVVTTREPIDDDDLKPGIRDTYEEIFGVRHIRHQAVDVIWIPIKGEFVDVRIDFPFGMHRDVGEAAQERVRTIFSQLINADYLKTPVNIFPLINKIYRAPREGTVVELAFGTTTASNKVEKMRRKALCLREETYHKGGKAALGTPIEPYRLSVLWKLPLSGGKYSTPELSLNSTSRAAHGDSPGLWDAVIRNCIGFSDYEHVLSRIEHHLK